MGLFSSKKTIYVSSTAYNMAGDLADRPNYLKTTVLGGILLNSPKESLADTIVNGQLHGPHFDQRAFYRWYENNYPEGEFSGEVLNNTQELSAAEKAALVTEINAPAGYTVRIQTVMIDTADVGYWAEQHIMLNRPEDLPGAWTAEYNQATGKCKITYPDTSTEEITLTGFTEGAQYLYCYYELLAPDSSDGWVNGTLYEDEASRPDTVTGFDPAWSQTSYNENITNESLTKHTKTTDDNGTPADPADDTITDDYVYTNDDGYTSTEILDRAVYLGPDPNEPRVRTRNEKWSIWRTYAVVTDYSIEVQNDTPLPGHTRTIEIWDDRVEHYWDHRQDTEMTYQEDVSNGQRLFIYKMGGANTTLNNLSTIAATMDQFFPVVPLRRDNVSISDPTYSAYYDNVATAFEKLTGTDIADTLTEIENHADIDDIDHCYVVLGVELNAPENHGKRYLYEFLKELMSHQNTTIAEVVTWSSDTAYTDYLADLQAWQDAQSNPADPLYQTPIPTQVTRDMPNYNYLECYTPSSHLDLLYRIKLHWLAIGETDNVGLGQPGASVGDLWWEVLPDVTVDSIEVYAENGEVNPGTNWSATQISDQVVSHVKLYWQYAANNYKVLEIYGLYHENIIYEGHSVVITAKEALEDTTVSGFIVPMHYPTLKLLPLVHANELALTNRIMIFNSYEVVKQQWWQTGLFAFLFAILVAVVVGLVFPGAAGLLGTNLVVGSALGFTGTAALIVGAAVNAIAAVVLGMVIQMGAIALFGEELGAILSVVITFFAFHMVSNFFNNGQFAINWSELMKVDNLLKLTDAVAQGFSVWSEHKIADIAKEYEEAEQAYNEELDYINRHYLDILGYGQIYFDPLWMTDFSESPEIYPESRDAFISRTLLTGSEIADISLSLIGAFPEISLTLPTEMR